MPFIASSAQGLTEGRRGAAEAREQMSCTASRAHDGARPGTAAVCRHLLGDIFQVPAGERPAVERAGA